MTLVKDFVVWADSASELERIEAVKEISLTYLDENANAANRAVCENIFSFCLDDPSPLVRAAMAEILSPCDHVPDTLVWSLSQDIPLVAQHVFEHSKHLCARTLVEAVNTGTSPVQVAIAGRFELDVDTVCALVAKGSAAAVLALLENTAIVLGPNLQHDIADRLGEDPAIRCHLLRMEELKPQTRQMLVARLSNSLFSLVDQKQWADRDRMEVVTSDSTNRVTINIAMETRAEDMADYVDHLLHTEQLTPALLLRAICAGNASFFEHAFAALSGMSLKRVQSIVDENRRAAFKSLFKRTGLPLSSYGVFSAAIAVWKKLGALELDQHMGEASLCLRAITDILKMVENNQELDGALLTMLRRLSAETAREAARENDPQLLLEAA